MAHLSVLRFFRAVLLLVMCVRLHAKDRVFRIGFDHVPPNQLIDANGKPYGLAIEVVTEAARRAGVKLQWVHTPGGADIGFPSGSIDLFPLFTEMPERLQFAYFSEPWKTTTYALIWRTDSGVTRPEEFGKRRLAATPDRWATHQAAVSFPLATAVAVPAQQDVLRAICAGSAEGGLIFANPSTIDGLHPEPSCQPVALRSIRLEESGGRLGVAARKADADAVAAARRIRAAMESMWTDGTMAGGYLKWMASTSFERETLERLKQANRRNLELRVVAGLAAALTLILAWVVWRLRRVTRARSQFLATMSHEIRTPMNGVLGMAELLESSGLTQGQSEMVSTMRDSGEALLDILNEILDSAKLDSGQMRYAAQPFDLWSVAEGIAGVFWATGCRRGVDVRVEISGGTPRTVVGDSVRVRQILMNLVGNALRFTEAGHVAITLAEAEGGVELAVCDTGVGIAAGQQRRIFEPFQQANDRTNGGTGLGLSICRRLTEGMGGRITVESELGKGTTFTVFLPLKGESHGLDRGPAVLLVPDGSAAREQADRVVRALGLSRIAVWTGAGPPPLNNAARVFRVAPQGQSSSNDWPVLTLPLRPSRLLSLGEDPPSAPAVDSFPCHVLVVEDNAVNRRVVRGLLENAGCTVEVAVNGLEALERAKDSFDLILMDCLMPEMDGWTATACIRARESGTAATSYIVALTANAFAEDKDRCRAAGMDDFLAKPVRKEDILRVLKSAHAKRAARAEANPEHSALSTPAPGSGPR